MPNYSSGKGLNINKLINLIKPNGLSHAYVLAVANWHSWDYFGRDIFAKNLIEINWRKSHSKM